MSSNEINRTKSYIYIDYNIDSNKMQLDSNGGVQVLKILSFKHLKYTVASVS